MNESNKYNFDNIVEEILSSEKLEEYTDAKLPIIASEVSGIATKVGITYEFMKNETENLLNSIESFYKALQKRGI